MLKKIKLKSSLVTCCFAIFILGLTACETDPKYPNIIEARATSDGTIALINSATKQQLIFKDCKSNTMTQRKILKQESYDDLDPSSKLCSSKNPRARLIDIEKLEIVLHKYQEPHGSVRCCVEIPSLGISACHVEPGKACSFGAKQ